MSEEKQCESCSDAGCKSRDRQPDETEEQYRERQELAARMCQIKHKVIVLSGKGGVGKSTVATNLAIGLAIKGAKVGLLDVDIHGPTVPKLLGLEEHRPGTGEKSLTPVRYAFSKRVVKVMSIGFLLPKQDDAVIWRGPLKMGAIKQFLKDVEWGELDFLVVDSPPGTGDEPLSVCQLIEDLDGAVVVTMPQEVSLADVRKSINFCQQLDLPVLGVVENMSGMACPKCGEVIEGFTTGGGEKMALEQGVPFLGRIPIDPSVMNLGDSGKPFMSYNPESPAAKAFADIVEPVLALDR